MVTSPKGSVGANRPHQRQRRRENKNSAGVLCSRLCGWLGVDHIHGKESAFAVDHGNEQTRVDHKRREKPAVPDRGGWFGVDTQPRRRHHLARRHEELASCQQWIEAGLSGAGGEIAYGEGSIWATLLGFPITRIDPATNKVAQQWAGKGGDSIRVGFGSVWLTELDAGVVWRIDPALQ